MKAARGHARLSMSSPTNKKQPVVKTRRREVRSRIFTDKVPTCFKAVLPKLKSLDNLELIREASQKHAAHLEDESTCAAPQLECAV